LYIELGGLTVNYIQVKNLRSLYDTGEIEMKKMNVLVGNNSSGKSTFLRIFPLLKQSFNKRINGPVLWAGDEDDYVDFGSYQEAFSNGSDENAIRFKLCFDSISELTNAFPTETGKMLITTSEENTVIIEFAISHNKETTYDYISEVILKYGDYHIVITYSDKYKILSLIVNDEEISVINEDMGSTEYSIGNEIFNLPLYAIKATARKNFSDILNINDEIDFIIGYFNLTRIGNFHEEMNTKEAQQAEEILRSVQERESELKKWTFLYYLPRYYTDFSEYIIKYFSNVYYIAPVRATAERYYRLRNAAVNEVDCRGKNLPVFLNSLKNEQFKRFQDWTHTNLGFEVEKSLSEGHVSLKIRKNGQDKAVNLSDTGFGYSQILPIVTQLWYITDARNKRQQFRARTASEVIVPVTIAIEQPELHLHPALQAKLMDVIAKIATEKNVRFIIETHSETIINRIGTLIDKGKFNNNDVEITIFDKQFGEERTCVKKSTFDEEGYLKDWPIGFFEPEED